MRVAVIGDTHLGRTLYGYDLTPSIRSTMYSFFRFCQEHDIKTAVHLGDLFDTPRPHLALEKLAIQWCNEFERAGIALHLLVGNHDVVSKGGINSALAPLKAIDYQHVMVHEAPLRLPTGSEGTDLVFVPFPSPALYDEVSGWLSDIQAAMSKVQGQAIIFSHLNVEGAKLGEQDWVYRGGDYSIPPELPHIDSTALVVSGHIHKQQWLPGRHVALGASQRLRFSEHRNPVNFLLLDSPEGKDGCELYETGCAIELLLWEADASAWGGGGTPPDGNDLLASCPDVEGMLVKVQPFVDEQTSIDWGRVEGALYESGAEHVTVLSPIFAKRKEKQKPKAAVVGEPVKAAAFFIKSRIKDQPERKAVMRTFKRLQQGVDADG